MANSQPVKGVGIVVEVLSLVNGERYGTLEDATWTEEQISGTPDAAFDLDAFAKDEGAGLGWGYSFEFEGTIYQGDSKLFQSAIDSEPGPKPRLVHHTIIFGDSPPTPLG
jgi:hypothetical protein